MFIVEHRGGELHGGGSAGHGCLSVSGCFDTALGGGGTITGTGGSSGGGGGGARLLLVAKESTHNEQCGNGDGSNANHLGVISVEHVD